MQCLDERKLKEYLRGSLPAEMIIPASEHIRACNACRGKLAELHDYAKAAVAIGSIATASEECPEYETLSAFVDEQLESDEFRAVERHVLNCELCWHDLETLQGARSRASLAPTIVVAPSSIERARTWTVFGWRSAAATALGAAGLAVVLMMTRTAVVHGPGSRPTTIAKAPAVTAPAPHQNTPTVRTPHGTTTVVPNTPRTPAVPGHTPNPEPRTIRVAELRDGGVSVDRVNGRVQVRSHGSDLESAVASLVQKKLRDGKLPATFTVASNPDSVLRGPSDVVDVQKITPKAGAYIESPRPAFKWAQVSGAERYRIEISKPDGTTVLYNETTNSQFHPAATLAGGYYKWTVSYRLGELAEWNTSRATMFRVFSKSEISLLNTAKRQYSRSHLVMGSVYERLGMKDEAVKEFEALAKENPGSTVAARLLAGAKSQ